MAFDCSVTDRQAHGGLQEQVNTNSLLDSAWLRHVDDGFSSPEAVDLLKLGLGSEIDSIVLQQIRSASGLYQALLQSSRGLDEVKVLQMFLSVMRMDSMGRNLVQNMSLYKIPGPKPLKDDEMSDKFRLNHHLLQICTKVKGTSNEDQLIAQLSLHLPNCGKRNFVSLAQIFIEMTSGPNPLLNPSNIRESCLVRILQDLGNGAHVLPYINDFLKSMGESPVETAAGTPTEADFSSSTETQATTPHTLSTKRLDFAAGLSAVTVTDETLLTQKEENIKRWLYESNDSISGSTENLELVKFSFAGDLTEKDYFLILLAKSLPEIFAVLRCSEMFPSISRLLSRFVYTLKCLGKDRGGRQCVERASCLFGELPDFELASLSMKSQFCLCLVRIRAHLRSSAAVKLRAFFSESMPCYRENTSTLVYIFTMMLHDKIISEVSQMKLIKALLVIGAHRCMKFIEKYRAANGLPQVLVNRETLSVDECTTLSENPQLMSSEPLSEKYNTLTEIATIHADQFNDSGSYVSEKSLFSSTRSHTDPPKRRFPDGTKSPHSKSQHKQGEVMRVSEVELYKYQMLGSGMFGCVFEGVYNQQPCAIKVLNPMGMLIAASLPLTSHVQEEALKLFEQECRFLQTIKHANVVEYYAVFKHPECNLPVLVMERLDCNLRKYISEFSDKLVPSIQLKFVNDISKALDYLHTEKIVRRDLCGDNILLKFNASSDSDTPLAKISDFGMSRIIETDTISQTMTTFGHRSGYLPPEAKLSPAHYNKSVDIFMLGAIMTQIVAKEAHIRSPEHRNELTRTIPEHHSLKRIILQCLSEVINERPLASDLVVELNDIGSF